MDSTNQARQRRALSATMALAGCLVGLWSADAMAACKKYPTSAESRSGAIGEALNDHNVDAISASDEQPCMRDEPPAKKPRTRVPPPPPPPSAAPPPTHATVTHVEPSGDPKACVNKPALPQCEPK